MKIKSPEDRAKDDYDSFIGVLQLFGVDIDQHSEKLQSIKKAIKEDIESSVEKEKLALEKEKKIKYEFNMYRIIAIFLIVIIGYLMLKC